MLSNVTLPIYAKDYIHVGFNEFIYSKIWIYIFGLYVMIVKYKRLNYSNKYMHSIRLPDLRILNSIGNIHSFYRNLLCILRNFWENRKILAQNRKVGQGFLRQCLRGMPVSILRSPHPRVLLLKNSLPPSYGSITWKLSVFFIEALHLNIKDTILLQTMRSRVCACLSFSPRNSSFYSS